MDSDTATVAVLAPMITELRPLLHQLGNTSEHTTDGRYVHVGRCGQVRVVTTLAHIGPARAGRSTEFLLDRFDVGHVFVTGVAGGIGESRVDEVVEADAAVDFGSGERFEASPLQTAGATRRGTVVTTDGYLLDAEALAALAAEGTLAVDMETAAVARVCFSRGVPWTAVRGISDLAADATDDRILTVVRHDGSVDPGGLVRYLAGDPRRVRTLAELAVHGRRAAAVAAEATLDAIRTMPG